MPSRMSMRAAISHARAPAAPAKIALRNATRRIMTIRYSQGLRHYYTRSLFDKTNTWSIGSDFNGCFGSGSVSDRSVGLFICRRSDLPVARQSRLEDWI